MNGMADALSRQEKDVPANAEDKRVKTREFQLLKPAGSPDDDDPAIRLMSAHSPGDDPEIRIMATRLPS
jgi:hypothetical protein